MNRLLMNSKGFTLVEILLAAFILGILIMVIVPALDMTQKGYTSLEAMDTLKTGTQRAVNRLEREILENKRLFQDNPSDATYQSRVDLTGLPIPLPGSRLPVVETQGALSAGSTSFVFVSTSVGNSLFFARGDVPRDVPVFVGGATVTFRIDTYRFNYYFLAEDSSGRRVGGQPVRQLWEWESVSFADYDQLMFIGNPAAQLAVMGALPGQGVGYAWDTSQATAGNAFFVLFSTGGIAPAPAGFQIAQRRARNMIKEMAGITVGGFRYSVSPNTGGGFTPRHQVPEFATAAGSFPSGFEVVAVGPRGNRQVYVRLVTAAEGSFKGTASHEQAVLATLRDIW